MSNGWPYYNYSGVNMLQFIVSRGVACLSYATINATWQSGIFKENSLAYFSPEIPQPTVTSLDPSSGPVSGDTSVMVNGENFFPGDQILHPNNLQASVASLEKQKHKRSF
jgi:hypothetical protein